MNFKQQFSDLDIKWKILIIIGILALIICITLSIVLILIFKSDVIPVDNISHVEDISEFDDFFNDLDNKNVDGNIPDKNTSDEIKKDLDNLKEKINILIIFQYFSIFEQKIKEIITF